MSFPLKNHGWTRIDTDLNHLCSSVFIRGLFSNFEMLDIIFDSFLKAICKNDLKKEGRPIKGIFEIGAKLNMLLPP
jgi:hypothetical protein